MGSEMPHNMSEEAVAEWLIDASGLGGGAEMLRDDAVQEASGQGGA